MVNADGERFLDEGADFRNYTYAKYGRVVLEQPGSYAWQVFDSQVKPLLRDEYKLRGATKVGPTRWRNSSTGCRTSTGAQFLKTVRDYNAAIKRDVEFDPEHQGWPAHRRAATINKTNWANTHRASRRSRPTRSAAASPSLSAA